MAITFDHATNLINLTAPHTTDLQIQDLLYAIQDAEDSEDGIQYGKIADASGKADLGGSVATGITVALIDPWQLKHVVGSYQAVIKDGNIVGGPGGNPVAYVAGVQVKLVQSAAGTIATALSGSGLDAGQDEKLTALYEAHYNKRFWDKVADTITLFGDDKVTPLFIFDTNDDMSEITPQ